MAFYFELFVINPLLFCVYSTFSASDCKRSPDNKHTLVSSSIFEGNEDISLISISALTILSKANEVGTSIDVSES